MRLRDSANVVNVNTSAALTHVIRREVDRRDISDAEFARRAGMTKATLSRKLQGKSKFFADEMPAIADALGWSTSHLWMQVERVADLSPRDLTPDELDALSDRIAADLNDPEVDAARAAFFAEQERKKRSR